MLSQSNNFYSSLCRQQNFFCYSEKLNLNKTFSQNGTLNLELVNEVNYQHYPFHQNSVQETNPMQEIAEILSSKIENNNELIYGKPKQLQQNCKFFQQTKSFNQSTCSQSNGMKDSNQSNESLVNSMLSQIESTQQSGDICCEESHPINPDQMGDSQITQPNQNVALSQNYEQTQPNLGYAQNSLLQNNPSEQVPPEISNQSLGQNSMINQNSYPVHLNQENPLPENTEQIQNSHTSVPQKTKRIKKTKIEIKFKELKRDFRKKKADTQALGDSQTLESQPLLEPSPLSEPSPTLESQPTSELQPTQESQPPSKPMPKKQQDQIYKGIFARLCVLCRIICSLFPYQNDAYQSHLVNLLLMEIKRRLGCNETNQEFVTFYQIYTQNPPNPVFLRIVNAYLPFLDENKTALQKDNEKEKFITLVKNELKKCTVPLEVDDIDTHPSVDKAVRKLHKALSLRIK